MTRNVGFALTMLVQERASRRGRKNRLEMALERWIWRHTDDEPWPPGHMFCDGCHSEP